LESNRCAYINHVGVRSGTPRSVLLDTPTFQNAPKLFDEQVDQRAQACAEYPFFSSSKASVASPD